MHDNAPVHTATTTKAYLRLQGIQPIAWPPYSPDLNPIETVWNRMKDWIEENYQDKAFTYPQLRRIVQRAWDEAITPEFLWDTLCTMPQRCQDVIMAEGGYVKW